MRRYRSVLVLHTYYVEIWYDKCTRKAWWLQLKHRSRNSVSHTYYVEIWYKKCTRKAWWLQLKHRSRNSVSHTYYVEIWYDKCTRKAWWLQLKHRSRNSVSRYKYLRSIAAVLYTWQSHTQATYIQATRRPRPQATSWPFATCHIHKPPML